MARSRGLSFVSHKLIQDKNSWRISQRVIPGDWKFHSHFSVERFFCSTTGRSLSRSRHSNVLILFGNRLGWSCSQFERSEKQLEKSEKTTTIIRPSFIPFQYFYKNHVPEMNINWRNVLEGYSTTTKRLGNIRYTTSVLEVCGIPTRGFGSLRYAYEKSWNF